TIHDESALTVPLSCASRSAITTSWCAPIPLERAPRGLYCRRVALGVCLLFDHSAERTVRWVWDRVESRGVPSLRSHTHGRHRPHLSYVVLVNWELDELRSSIEALAHREPFDVTFDA